MKLPKLSPAQYTFYGLGVATTAGSILGTYRGIESELGTSLAIVGSAALGVMTYAALNVLFNHKGTAKRVGAAILSVSCVIVSGETILLGAINKMQRDNTAALTLSAQQAATEKDQALLDDNQIKSDLRLQLKTLSKANAQDRSNAETQQGDIRSQIAEIRRLNSIDETRIAGFQKNVDRRYKPSGNRANIRAARKEIDARLKNIDQLNRKITDIGNALLANTQHREAQSAAINERLTTQSVTVISAASIAAPVALKKISIGTRVRCYLNDLMTVVFLLLVSWYRPESATETSNDSTHLLNDTPDDTNNLSNDSKITEEQFDAFADLLPDSADTSLTTPTLDADQSALSTGLSCNVGERSMQHRKTKGEHDGSEEIQPLHDDATIIAMLEKRQITPNLQGKITPSMIQKISARMNSPRTAKSFLENAVNMGIVDSIQDGKRGFSFAYPSVVTRQSPLKLVITGV